MKCDANIWDGSSFVTYNVIVEVVGKTLKLLNGLLCLEKNYRFSPPQDEYATIINIPVTYIMH